MDRDALARLMVLASQRGSNPMGGSQPYMNDMPGAPSTEQVPPSWMPPGVDYNRPPQGNYLPSEPPAWSMPIPRFHIPPGKELNRRSGAVL